MVAERMAEVTWRGTLEYGGGVATGVSSGAFRELPMTWRARTTSYPAGTGPEELLAAAHATSFAMALAGELERAGVSPRDTWQLDVADLVTLVQTETGWRVVASRLAVRGDVAGLDGAQFGALAAAALKVCPISQALGGNVAVSLDAVLAGAGFASAGLAGVGLAGAGLAGAGVQVAAHT